MTAPDIPEDIRAAIIEAIREVDIVDCARRFMDVPISQIKAFAGGLEEEYGHAADAALKAIEPFIASERTRATEAERERCAKICDDYHDEAWGHPGEQAAAFQIAATIREVRQ